MSNTKKMSSIIFYIFIITFIFLAYVKKNEGLTAFFLKKATISSKNNKPTIISLQKYVDLSGYTSIKMLVYSDKEDIESIKKFQLRLGNKDNSSSYEYDIRTIKPGWNIIQISKDKFTFVSKFSSENKFTHKGKFVF